MAESGKDKDFCEIGELRSDRLTSSTHVGRMATFPTQLNYRAEY